MHILVSLCNPFQSLALEKMDLCHIPEWLERIIFIKSQRFIKFQCLHPNNAYMYISDLNANDTALHATLKQNSAVEDKGFPTIESLHYYK